MTNWPRQSECLRLFGNPHDPGWEAKHIVRVPVPWIMHMGEIRISGIKVNKIAADSLARVLQKIWDRCDHSQAKVAAGHCDCFSGDWAVRPIRGKATPSMHAYGLAIDFDAPHNPLGAKEPRSFFKPDSLLVRCFKEEGWIWGGDWTGRRDAMHVQAAIVG